MKLSPEQVQLLQTFAEMLAIANGHPSPAEYADCVVNGPPAPEAPVQEQVETPEE